jgi:hypothetical protein
MLTFATFLALAILIPAIPGFCYFYFYRDASAGIALFVGIVTGQFLLVVLDPILGLYCLLKRMSRRKGKETCLHNTEPKKVEPSPNPRR